MNFQVKISAEGKPTLEKSKRELEATLRTQLPDTTVDLAMLHLEMSGRAVIKYKGKTLTLEKVW